MYEKVVTDEIYLNTMKKIEKLHFIDNGKWDWEHGIAHAVRVSHYIRKILTDLKQPKEIIELGQVAGLLHDIGLIDGEKKGHAIKSASYVSDYLDRYGIVGHERKTIIRAIADHSKGNQIESMIGAALCIADKMDITYHRVIGSTITDEINRGFMKMKKVSINVTSDIIWIDYQTDEGFDLSLLKNWESALVVPIRASTYLGLDCIFRWNQKQVDINKLLGV